jgi:hypothetical protein
MDLNKSIDLQRQIAVIEALNLSAKKVADSLHSISDFNTSAPFATLNEAFQRQCDVVDQLLRLLGKVIDKM